MDILLTLQCLQEGNGLFAFREQVHLFWLQVPPLTLEKRTFLRNPCGPK